MNRTATVVLTAISALSVLAGCGGDDPYCAAVEDNRSALEAFSAKKTTAAFTREAEAMRSIASTAPDGVKDDWAAVGAAMDKVIKAQKKAGVTMQEMQDVEKVAQIDQDDLDAVTKAYDSFNKTSDRRVALVEDVRDVCDIKLK